MKSFHKAIEREELARIFGQLVLARLVALPVAVSLVCWLLWVRAFLLAPRRADRGHGDAGGPASWPSGSATGARG